MKLIALRRILSSVPATYDEFDVLSIDQVRAVANGFYCVNVPVNNVALDLQRGELLLMDEKQASIIGTVGNVPVKMV